MKVIIILSFFSVLMGFGQSNTEVFLFDLEVTDNKIEVDNGKNISNNEGYDNQPAFLNDDKILFASTRNGQTDIAQYHVNYNSKIFINSTEGGEYTPLKIPNKNAVSAVRLDKDGKQRLYAYDLSNGESTELINDLVVAYYTWYDENTTVSAVIEDEQLNLFVTNISENKSRKYATNVGRSFHKIPNSKLVSFIYKESDKQWQIRSLDPLTGKNKLIANSMEGVEDICWLNGRTLLSGKNGTLYKLTLKRDNNWKKVADLSSYGIANITRLSTNPQGTKLLIAGDLISEMPDTVEDTNTPNAITTQSILTEAQAAAAVQKHVEPFNKRQLNDFANTFDKDVVVNRFPKDYMYSGRNALKENYRQFFKNNEKANIKVLNRMVLKNKVIDEELVTINNITVRQATIYDVDKDGINAMTFIRNKNATSNPETIVNKQLEAYNTKDIDEFTKTYSKDITLHLFPDDLTTNGNADLKKRYDAMFEKVPDLNAEIVNRIVLGNKVIDKEKVTINGKIYYAIAIYEVKDGLISKVTFIQ
ncbi:nuclear transport factor 2 family protein [Winogradskyella luteola]|uniref:Nuclear transport factor 2 family protein n=1 Tax=Winogradskyella luteola TaxID=2828330 RepID=A0A9X1F8K7_9FLAO|nr:nuclear transport factor 2 family protein [Winogradskyella luteola]MBV7268603.1 nuclear transport factor 2 family protein [Winogradskyella luteola]